MTATPARINEVLSFGPFSLIANERLLTKHGAPIELSSRALDILIALLSRPNDVVSKNELLAQVWPDVTVAEGSLRYRMTYLRKELGDGQDGARYITTLSGRGYAFVAPISLSGEAARKPTAPPAAFHRASLPNRLTRMIGRDDGVLMLATQLPVARFITIVGAGGVGKTTLAVTVGHDPVETFEDGVFFVDLGALSDANLVASSVASTLGLSVQSGDTAISIIAYLRDKRTLLILDKCEHLIEAAATLAERIFAAAPDLHIHATSREPLRVEGEHVHRLGPLAAPPEGPARTAV